MSQPHACRNSLAVFVGFDTQVSRGELATPTSDLTPSIDVQRLGVRAYDLCVSSRSNWIDKLSEYLTRAGDSEHARSFRSTSLPSDGVYDFFFAVFSVSSCRRPLSAPPLLGFSPRWWMICCLVGRAHSSSAEKFPAMGLVPSICWFASLRCYILRIPSGQTHSLVNTLCDDACHMKRNEMFSVTKY